MTRIATHCDTLVALSPARETIVSFLPKSPNPCHPIRQQPIQPSLGLQPYPISSNTIQIQRASVERDSHWRVGAAGGLAVSLEVRGGAIRSLQLPGFSDEHGRSVATWSPARPERACRPAYGRLYERLVLAGKERVRVSLPTTLVLTHVASPPTLVFFQARRANTLEKHAINPRPPLSHHSWSQAARKDPVQPRSTHPHSPNSAQSPESETKSPDTQITNKIASQEAAAAPRRGCATPNTETQHPRADRLETRRGEEARAEIIPH